MGMSINYGTPEGKGAMIKLMCDAVERGVTYSPFTNEKLVGEALAPVPDKVVIATKFGFDIDPVTHERHGFASAVDSIEIQGGRGTGHEEYL
jgi:aryl-alcohol dehydrogenase-like predicted oxidoreductase